MSIPAQPSPAWTDNVLDPMRQVADLLAGAVVADVFQQGQTNVLALWPGDHHDPLLLWATLLLRRGKGRAGSGADNTVVLEPDASRH